MPELKIAPSILSANLGRLNEEIKSVEPFSHLLHFDVMDGHFVPNLSIGPCVLENMQTSLPVDCHLMIDNPDQYLDDFKKAGAASVSVHFEACKNLKKTLALAKSLDLKVCIAIKPATAVTVLDPYFAELDMVLIMSVEPGFSGQHFMDVCLPKIEYVRKKYPDLDIEVDGGINDQTISLVKKAGANVIVSASYIFESADRREAIEKLKNL